MLPNTVLNRVPRDRLSEPMQRGWDHALMLHGDTTYVEVMANSPFINDWYMNDFYKKVFYSGHIDMRVVELVRLRLANIHGCAMCNRGDKVAAREAGISQEAIDALPAYETGPFTEAEKAALVLADQMVLTNTRGNVSPELYARLKPHFTDAQLVELGVIMAVLCGMAKFIFTYDLVEKEDSCPFLPIAAE